jgi:hypothetical protein
MFLSYSTVKYPPTHIHTHIPVLSSTFRLPPSYPAQLQHHPHLLAYREYILELQVKSFSFVAILGNVLMKQAHDFKIMNALYR